MKNEFIQPVSMYVTKEQYEKDLRVSLLMLGYEEVNITKWHTDSIVVTNLAGNMGVMSNTLLNGNRYYNRYFIDHYNPLLFLAIAAMTKGESPIAGEWLVCINEHNLYDYKIGDLVLNKNPYLTLALYRRATLQELINKFTNQNTMKQLDEKTLEELKNLIAPENKGKFEKLMGIAKPSTKKDLQTGDVVKVRCGSLYLIIRDVKAGHFGAQEFGAFSSNGFLASDEYAGDLKIKGIKDNPFDVMEIYRRKSAGLTNLVIDRANRELIWSR